MESTFREHLHTNYVPNDAEIECICAHLAPHEAELARLDSLIRELTIQRDRVKAYIEAHRALISHARHLPQDILEEIFLDCLRTHHNAIMSTAEAPLLLSRICSAWRFHRVFDAAALDLSSYFRRFCRPYAGQGSRRY
jgi:hypothetical protein